MAITAAITLSSSTANANAQVIATCTISNSGGSDVDVQSCSPVGFVSASTYRDFIAADWTDTPGSDFSDFVVTAQSPGARGDGSTLHAAYNGASEDIAVPQSGSFDSVDPAITMTAPPSWYEGETATISASSGTISVVNAGQPQFPSVPLIFGDPASASNPQNFTVPASGSLALVFGVIAKAPNGDQPDQAYDIGATVVTSGGVTTYATVATLTVSAP